MLTSRRWSAPSRQVEDLGHSIALPDGQLAALQARDLAVLAVGAEHLVDPVQGGHRLVQRGTHRHRSPPRTSKENTVPMTSSACRTAAGLLPTRPRSQTPAWSSADWRDSLYPPLV